MRAATDRTSAIDADVAAAAHLLARVLLEAASLERGARRADELGAAAAPAKAKAAAKAAA